MVICCLFFIFMCCFVCMLDFVICTQVLNYFLFVFVVVKFVLMICLFLSGLIHYIYYYTVDKISAILYGVWIKFVAGLWMMFEPLCVCWFIVGVFNWLNEMAKFGANDGIDYLVGLQFFPFTFYRSDLMHFFVLFNFRWLYVFICSINYGIID